MRVEVYFNLPKKIWSVLDLATGRVVEHVDEITIENPVFSVQPAGRAKVIRQGRKNVHAVVRGERLEQPQVDADANAVSVTYNPYKCCEDCGTLELCAGLPTCRATFITLPDGAPIHTADMATLSGKNVTAYEVQR